MEIETEKEAGGERVLGLDLLRALAALWVVAIHGDTIVRSAIPSFPNIIILDPVDLFFALSGFLIGRIILREIVDEVPGGLMRSLGRFWVRRWLRTIPAYYAAVAATYLFCLFYPYLQTGLDWRYAVFLQNAWTQHPSFMGNAWSLSIEEYFYLLFPLATVLFFAVFRTRRRAAFLAAALLFIGGSVALRWHLVDALAGAQGAAPFDTWCRKFLPARLDAIAYGTIGALVAVARPALWRTCAIPAALAGAVLYLAQQNLSNEEHLFWAIRPAIMPLVTLLLLPLITRLRAAPRWFAAPIRHLSRISYSMYLVHYPLVLIPIISIIQPRGPLHALAWYTIYFVVTLLLTYALHHAAERPGLAWRKKISARWRERGD